MHLPKYHELEEFHIRSKKLEDIRNLEVDPYPHSYQPDHSTATILQQYKDEPIGNSEDAASGKTPLVKIAGRLVLFRTMGKNAFAHLQDETGRLQFMCNREETVVDGYDPAKSKEPLSHIKFIEKKIDLGDIVGVEGNLFRTHTGEITLFAKKVTLLCKSLLPLPDKHGGLVDPEQQLSAAVEGGEYDDGNEGLGPGGKLVHLVGTPCVVLSPLNPPRREG